MPDPNKQTPQKPSWYMPEGTRLHKCFMSEKWCTFERDINECLQAKERRVQVSDGDSEKAGARPKAFVIMPFETLFDQIFEYQICPMLEGLGLSSSRADTVMRTGYVVCEKICKQIQEADLVVAEITEANQNVMYELGLAAGLRRRILFMTQERDPGAITPSADRTIKQLGVPHGRDRRYLGYIPFHHIQANAKDLLEKRVWEPSEKALSSRQTLAKVGLITSSADKTAPWLEDLLDCMLSSVILEILIKSTPEAERESKRNKFREEFAELIEKNSRPDKPQDLQGVAPQVQWMLVDYRRANERSFHELMRFVEDCDCIIVDTSPQADHINFFWLGYAHAKGKNVIPMTVSEETRTPSSVVTSPFDVRGLWHIYLEKARPQTLGNQFSGIMEKIIKDDIEKRAKREFWEPFLKDVEVRVIVGANKKSKPPRYMVGEWDYLTLAEIVGFLSREKPTLDIQIASPVYQKETGDVNHPDKDLRAIIAGKNCILIASPDVNIVTELTLARKKWVKPFSANLLLNEGGFEGFVGFKEGSRRGFVHWRHMTPAVFSSKYIFSPEQEKRLAKSPDGDQENEKENKAKAEDDEVTFYNTKFTRTGKYSDWKEKVVELDAKTDDGPFEGLYGHMAFFRNPYSGDKEDKYILILSGISGPATMAMAQILTGCMNPDVTVNGLLNHHDAKERQKGKDLIENFLELVERQRKEAPEDRDGIIAHRLKPKAKPGDNNAAIKTSGTEASQRQDGEIANTSLDQEVASSSTRPGGTQATASPPETDFIEAMKEIINEKAGETGTGPSKVGEKLLNYQSFSESLLVDLNTAIKEKKEVEALFYVVIGDTKRVESALEDAGWNDSRRILLWGLADCDEKNNPSLDNPAALRRIRDIKDENQWQTKQVQPTEPVS